MAMRSIYMCLLLSVLSHANNYCKDIREGAIPNMYLEGFVHVNLTEYGFQQCLTKCWKHPLCQSVNYNKQAMYCELNTETDSTASLSYNKGYTFRDMVTDITSWNQNVGCQKNTCGIHEVCVDMMAGTTVCLPHDTPNVPSTTNSNPPATTISSHTPTTSTDVPTTTATSTDVPTTTATSTDVPTTRATSTDVPTTTATFTDVPTTTATSTDVPTTTATSTDVPTTTATSTDVPTTTATSTDVPTTTATSTDVPTTTATSTDVPTTTATSTDAPTTTTTATPIVGQPIYVKL